MIARAVAGKLSELRPGDKAYFDQRLADFSRRIDEAEKGWLATLAPYKGLKVITYHRSYTNFADRFGLEVVGYVEPRPGIPPTPQHTLDLVNEMNRQKVKLILVEPYFDLKTPNAIARQTGGQVHPTRAGLGTGDVHLGSGDRADAGVLRAGVGVEPAIEIATPSGYPGAFV